MEEVRDGDEMYKDLPENTPVNSLRDNPDLREWQDPINKVRSMGLPGCKEEHTNGDITMANVHGMTLRYGNDPEENEHRVSITVGFFSNCFFQKFSFC